MMTIGDAWKLIDKLASEAGRPVPRKESEVRELGPEAVMLFEAIEAAHDRIALAGLRSEGSV